MFPVWLTRTVMSCHRETATQVCGEHIPGSKAGGWPDECVCIEWSFGYCPFRSPHWSHTHRDTMLPCTLLSYCVPQVLFLVFLFKNLILCVGCLAHICVCTPCVGLVSVRPTCVYVHRCVPGVCRGWKKAFVLVTVLFL